MAHFIDYLEKGGQNEGMNLRQEGCLAWNIYIYLGLWKQILDRNLILFEKIEFNRNDFSNIDLLSIEGRIRCSSELKFNSTTC